MKINFFQTLKKKNEMKATNQLKANSSYFKMEARCKQCKNDETKKFIL